MRDRRSEGSRDPGNVITTHDTRRVLSFTDRFARLQTHLASDNSTIPRMLPKCIPPSDVGRRVATVNARLRQ